MNGAKKYTEAMGKNTIFSVGERSAWGEVSLKREMDCAEVKMSA